MGSVVLEYRPGKKMVDVVKSLMSPKVEVVKSKSVGSAIYMAVRRYPGGSVGAVVALVRHYRKSSEVEVKIMDEREGPYYYDCPPDVMSALSPSDDPVVNEWRMKCMDRAYKKASPLMPNDKIEFNGRRYVVLGKAGGRYGYLIRAEDGKLFRLPLNRRADCNIVA